MLLLVCSFQLMCTAKSCVQSETLFAQTPDANGKGSLLNRCHCVLYTVHMFHQKRGKHTLRLFVIYQRTIPTALVNKGAQCTHKCVLCKQSESLGGWHKVGLEQLRKLGSALARHTGQEEGETISHLLTRASVLLQKGLSALLLNRIPSFPTPAIGGTQ